MLQPSARRSPLPGTEGPEAPSCSETYRKAAPLERKATPSPKTDKWGAAQGGEGVCPQIHIWKGPKTTSRAPSASGAFPNTPLMDTAINGRLTRMKTRSRPCPLHRATLLPRPCRGEPSARGDEHSGFPRTAGASRNSGTGLATGQPRCRSAKGSPNKNLRLLVSVALQNFTSEAETKGKTNQKDREATRGEGGGRGGFAHC